MEAVSISIPTFFGGGGGCFHAASEEEKKKLGRCLKIIICTNA